MRVYQDAVYWLDCKITEQKESSFWQTRCKAIILGNLVPANCFETILHTKTDGILYRNISSPPRLRPQIILNDSSQVQSEDYNQCGTSMERTVTDEGETEPTIDFRIQGIPNSAIEEGEDDRVRLIKW